MNVVIDILASFVVRAVIVLTILNLMLSLHQSLQKRTEEVYLNEVLSAPVITLLSDLKLAGYNASKTIEVAKPNEIIFFADIDTNGTSETIRYYLSSRILYRTINGGQRLQLATSVVNFRFRYFYANGIEETADQSFLIGIKSIYFRIRLQSTTLGTTSTTSGKSDSTYHTTQWEDHIFPKNL